MVTRICLAAMLSLAVLVACHNIKISIPCVVCGEATYEESILCRIAGGWNKNFMHDFCVYRYESKQLD